MKPWLRPHSSYDIGLIIKACLLSFSTSCALTKIHVYKLGERIPVSWTELMTQTLRLVRLFFWYFKRSAAVDVPWNPSSIRVRCDSRRCDRVWSNLGWRDWLWAWREIIGRWCDWIWLGWCERRRVTIVARILWLVRIFYMSFFWHFYIFSVWSWNLPVRSWLLETS